MSDGRQVRTAALVMVVLVAVWGYAWVLSKLALQYCGPLEFATLRTAVGAAFLFPAPLAAHTRPIEWTREFVVLTLLLGAVGSAGGWLAWFYVLRRLPAGTTSMSSLGIPVVALVGSVIQLGERPRTTQFAGIVLIAAALGIVSGDAIRKHREVEALMGQE